MPLYKQREHPPRIGYGKLNFTRKNYLSTYYQ